MLIYGDLSSFPAVMFKSCWFQHCAYDVCVLIWLGNDPGNKGSGLNTETRSRSDFNLEKRSLVLDQYLVLEPGGKKWNQCLRARPVGSVVFSDLDSRAARYRDCRTDSRLFVWSLAASLHSLLSFWWPSSIFLSVSLAFILWMMHRPLDRLSTHWKSAVTFADKLKAGARHYFTLLQARGSEAFSLTIMEIAAAGTWGWPSERQSWKPAGPLCLIHDECFCISETLRGKFDLLPATAGRLVKNKGKVLHLAAMKIKHSFPLINA